MMDIPEYELWKTDPSPDNMAKVIESLAPTINAEVHRYPGSKPITRGRAKSLAIKAVKSYDPSHGAQLRSWVVTQMQPLARYNQQMRPLRTSELAIRQAAELNRLREELSDTLGRDPNDAELADEIGLSVSRINTLRKSVKPTIYETAFESEDDELASSLPGTVDPDKFGIAEDVVYSSLGARDQMIYDLKVGRHGRTALANHQIAKRLGVTPALISQRSSQIANQIKGLMQKGQV
jgi:DNA-directed RNA polymerase specialized sigma subunit